MARRTPPREAKKTSPARGEAPRRLAELAAHLGAVGERLSQSVSEIPRAADFEPLAEHLYEFASNAPLLVSSLREISETLQFAHQSFAESLLKLPRAEDYEPLAGPLREFARVAPALAESLGGVPRLAAPLTESVRGLERIAASVEASSQRLAAAIAALGREPASKPDRAPPPLPSAAGEIPLREVAARVEGAHESLLEALATLPRASDYAPLVGQLRELATVSPSLMEWLREVPSVATPLADSVRGLQSAAAQLKEARDALRARLEPGEEEPDRR